MNQDNQLSFLTRHESHVKEITDFAMMQPETAVVRHDLQDVYGPAATPEYIAKYEKKITDREAAKEEKIRLNKATQAAIKKAEERAEKKKSKRKRKAAKRQAAAHPAGDGADSVYGSSKLEL